MHILTLDVKELTLECGRLMRTMPRREKSCKRGGTDSGTVFVFGFILSSHSVMNVMKAGSGVKPCSLGWTLNLAFLRPRWSLLTDNHIGLFLSNQQESLGSSLLGEAVVRCVILTVQPSNEVEQLLLQDLDVVIGFAGGGGGGGAG
jgi:hypothetical protein